MRRVSQLASDDEWVGPPSGTIHTCGACGKQDIWGLGWSWYGSYRDQDDGLPIFKACSDACMARREDVQTAMAHDLKLTEARRLLADAERRAVALRARVEALQGGIEYQSDRLSSLPREEGIAK
jgi:hypothetical protein